MRHIALCCLALSVALGLYACASAESDSATSSDASANGGSLGSGSKTGGTSGRVDGGANTGGFRSGGNSATGGSLASDGGVATIDAAAPTCALFIEAIDGKPLTSRLAAPGETIAVLGRVAGTVDTSTLDWRWSVFRSGVAITFTVAPGNPASISIPIDVAGVYQIRATASDLCQGTIFASSVTATERRTPYFVRVLPPPDAQSLPFEELLEIGGGLPPSKDFHLQGGTRIKIDPRNEKGIAVPSYIRITPRASTFVIEGYSGLQGGLVRQVAAITTHDILVVPTEPLPPRNFVGLTLAAIGIEPFTMAPGVAVRGTVRVNSQPVSNARLLFRQNGTPSTLGTTDANGSYVIDALPGRHGLVVEPSPESGLPQIALSEAAGIVFPANAPGAQVDLDFVPMPTAALTLSVRTPDGATPVRGARVYLATAQPKAAVATLTVNAGTPVPVAGNILRQLESDAFGVVRFVDLPRDLYVLRIVPPAGNANPGATHVDLSIDLTAGNVEKGNVSLGTRIKATGNLLPAARAVGVRVLALPIADLDPLSNSVSAVAGANGQFTLSLSPNQSYRFFAHAAAGREFDLPRTHLGDQLIGSTPVTLDPWTLPTGLVFSGRVYDPKQQLLPGTVIQIFCVGSSTTCVNLLSPKVDNALPVGEALTDFQGTFAIVLPDPGSSQSP
ncbi:MAG: carboxypeptidase-like regulatory domain-containing protein [Deltaproteobacteria bacterium]|nr:carboxypeptidase-like regulatory domain-containing protein [Deltaproteobacteria bacterium]